MKKQIMSVSAIALMVLAASCAKNETTPEIPDGNNVEQISFRSTTGKTRANDNTLTQVEGGFNVLGIDNGGGFLPGFEDPVGDAQMYWKNTGTGKWEWKTTPGEGEKMWPTDPTKYPLTFIAAFPASENVMLGGDFQDLVDVYPNLDIIGNDVGNTSVDGVPYALKASEVSIDFLSALSTVTTKPADGFTDLSFKHIMSNIAFAIEVPVDVKAVIHSIKIANVERDGVKYDYKNQVWVEEGTPALTHYAHFVATAGQAAQEITKANATVNGLTDGAGGFNTLKLKPQKNTVPWALGVDATIADSFRKDAKAWADATWADKAAAIDAWHKKGIGENGMKDSKGWKGARIEVVYCLVNTKDNKNLIGRLAGVDGAAETQYVRVGYPLDIASIDTKGDGTLMGLCSGYKYKFTIALGTPDATNGTLLDPDYKSNDGGNTEKPVDNPAVVTPGDPVSKEGVIGFNVEVKNWDDYSGSIK